MARVPYFEPPQLRPWGICGVHLQNLNSNTPWLRSCRIFTRSDQPFRNARFISKKFPFCPTVHRLWDHHLAEIAFAINTAKHETTKQSAAEILFGRNLVAPRQVRREGNVPYEIPQKTISEKEWLKIAETSAEASSKQKHYYDLRRREWFPKIGDQIYCRNHHLSSAVDHFAAKLAPKFSGPHKIVGKATNNILIVQMGKKRQNVHIQDVKPVHERKLFEYGDKNCLKNDKKGSLL
ncbi:hypothetical protein CVS40_1748 [Lucilia cuprina]|nr:hypothetical protein CVS40_1748 [Lucilia cuprina]